MEVISCVILVLVAGGYALWPLFAKNFNESAGAPAETDADYLAARKTALYRNIKDLEFEYKMGRLAENDFRQLEAEYKGEAAEILHKLDMLNVSAINPEPVDIVEKMCKAKEDACPGCGVKTIPGKKFCADCGARLH